ncbi:regulatory protein RecX [Legionella parisiensis]|uniref:Regulatory protein RecX n=1 Tax=Legionella parisiensis TaxID=45071 RepID=A0A1E5JMR6_9GAMM|nr:regulatory protein RecX [Legionella parisiensis]KTD41439.1 recombination regulator RecX [Legionella parisiensis]OEH45802.1 Regulatory protein RecX [Legionella parisiensis]STX76257.1 RecX-family regulatory protein [Legionella parisiensis]
MNHLLEVAIKLLSERHHTGQGLKQELEKGFSNHPELHKVIESTVNRLKELHLLNDHHKAETLAARYAHKGNRFISQVLHQKGVNNEAILQALQNMGDEYSKAMDEARRKMRGMHGESSKQKKTLLYRF